MGKIPSNPIYTHIFQSPFLGGTRGSYPGFAYFSSLSVVPVISGNPTLNSCLFVAVQAVFVVSVFFRRFDPHANRRLSMH